MSVGLRELQPHELDAELERVLLPRLVKALHSRDYGHCMRVTDLDHGLMVRLCRQLRARAPGAQVYVLRDVADSTIPAELGITSTKLVELRNPLPDGGLRPPLLVFVPSDARAAAEDSFGLATFEEMVVGQVYRDAAAALLGDIPNGLRGTIAEILRRLEAEKWPYADPVAATRYLLTVKLNDYDPDAAGAALFEFGLVPDFELLDDPARTPIRVARNLEKVRKITNSGRTERGRVLELGLKERAFRAKLANFLDKAGVEDPRSWTRRIVAERENWELGFHRWRFVEEDAPPDAVHVEVVETSLPVVGEDEEDERLRRLVGQQYLPIGRRGLKQFSVTFRVHPTPAKVQGLARFSVQVVSQDGGPVGLVRNLAAWRSTKEQATATFTRLGKVDWEEGWHFVRVHPITADGDPVPLLDEGVEGQRPNESDIFYVLPGGEVEEPPPQRAVPREDSLVHAWKRLQFTALLNDRDPADVEPGEVRWKSSSERAGPAGVEVIEAPFGREGTVHIPVTRPLKVLEQAILARPTAVGSWRLSLHLGQIGELVHDSRQWPDSPQAEAFFAARARWFDAVRNGAKELITQAADFRALRDQIVAYAEAYQELVASLLRRAETASEVDHALRDLRGILALDSVTLNLADHPTRRREAALLAPTHPLRALWFATWAELGERWLDAATRSEPEYVVPTRDALLRSLVPLACPPVLSRETGQLLTAVDNLTPYWALYAASDEGDPRGLIGDICGALRLPERSIGGATITGDYLASRVERYLIQHPYVRTLTVNAFNPGRATVLADMLLALQRIPTLADLCYDVRLFVSDSEASGAGEALVELISPASSVTAAEADAFSVLGASHLQPKLGLAVRSISEFRDNPERHAAHLTFLFDLFPGREVGVAPQDAAGSPPVHGLLQDFKREYTENADTVSWRKRPRHGQALELHDAEELTDLLSSLPALLSNATATVATGRVGAKLAPIVTLALDGQDRSLIHRVHEVSDWVITIDRNMGIEFYDHGGKPGRPDYLIDHSPDLTSELGHRLVITSRSLIEPEAMVESILTEYRLQAEAGRASALLDQLRFLSGRSRSS